MNVCMCHTPGADEKIYKNLCTIIALIFHSLILGAVGDEERDDMVKWAVTKKIPHI